MQTRTITLLPSFFLVLCLLAAPVMAATLTVTTDADTYSPGDTISVSGTAVANTDVTIQLLNPNGQLVDITYVRSGSDGSYSTSFKTPSTMPTGQWVLGTYTVKAFMGTQTATKTITIQQKIAVTGKVVDSAGEGVAGATVTVGTASGTTGADGSFTVSLSAEGTYTLKVTKTGYYTYTETVTASLGTNDVGTIQLTSLEDKIAALESEVGNLTESLETAQSDIASLKTQVQQLQAITTTVTQLQSTANSLQSSVNSLQSSVNALQATVAQLPAFYALAFIGIIIAVIAVILVYRKIAK
ncbi:MAG: carboxypeptidase regulatory-like domain-containing protein [Candidatus Methanomethyliales bacterium]|nr:carboxypeptidase regulatory-like domain-containing protein [Candidatus Methanomethylicales archaeon]